MDAVRVLVVEDEALVAQDIERKLRRAGYLPLAWISSGEEALASAIELQPTLILMDIRLSGEMDGIEAAAKIREQINIPIIFLTAYTDEGTLHRARLTEPTGYLMKPFEARELRSVIEIALFRHEIDQRLRESEARFRVFADLISDLAGVWQVLPDQTTRIEWIGGAVMQITGYSPEELLAFGEIDKIIHPDDRQTPIVSTQNILAGQHDVSEFRIITRSGKTRWIRSYGRLIQSQIAGEPLRIYRAFQDITSQKVEELRRQEHQYFLEMLSKITKVALETPDLQSLLVLLCNHLGAIVRSDGCDLVLFDSQQPDYLLSVASDRLPGVRYQVTPPADEQALLETLHWTDEPLIIEDINTHPLTRFAHAIYPNARAVLGLPLVAGNKRLGALILYFDRQRSFSQVELDHCQQAAQLASLAIDKFLLLQETMMRAEEMGALDSLSTAMRAAQTRSALAPAILSKVTQLLSAHAAALALIDSQTNRLVIELGALAWKGWTGVSYPADSGISGQVLTKNEPYCNNNTAATPDLVEARQLLSEPAVACVPLVAHGLPIGVLWIGRLEKIANNDLRLLTSIGTMAAIAIHRQTLHEKSNEQLKALKAAQARLLQSEKLAAIGELIAGVAHELNNPLTSILLNAQLAQETNRAPGIRNELNTIASEADRAASIVRSLLDFARQRTPERRPVQINDVLKSSLDLLAYELRSHNIQVDLRLAPDLPVTLVDPYQLQQVMINLINNAWQAMSQAKDCGQLRVSTKSEMSNFLGNQQTAQPIIQITIEDNGPGFQKTQLSRIFDPFFTTKPKTGTGLGLSICHGIISEHGGHIWAESTPGLGATFIIEIPLIHAVLPAAEAGSTEQAHIDARCQKPSILIVDDETAVLEVLGRALKRHNYQVDTVSSGEAALIKLNQKEYDLILCDIRMPGMNGQHLYEQIKKRWPNSTQRIIFTTGDTISLPTRQFLEETNVQFMSKPFDLKHFLQKVDSAIEELRNE